MDIKDFFRILSYDKSDFFLSYLLEPFSPAKTPLVFTFILSCLGSFVIMKNNVMMRIKTGQKGFIYNAIMKKKKNQCMVCFVDLKINYVAIFLLKLPLE